MLVVHFVVVKVVVVDAISQLWLKLKPLFTLRKHVKKCWHQGMCLTNQSCYSIIVWLTFSSHRNESENGDHVSIDHRINCVRDGQKLLETLQVESLN